MKLLFVLFLATSCGKVRMEEQNCEKSDRALVRCQNALDHCELVKENSNGGLFYEGFESTDDEMGSDSEAE